MQSGYSIIGNLTPIFRPVTRDSLHTPEFSACDVNWSRSRRHEWRFSPWTIFNWYMYHKKSPWIPWGSRQLFFLPQPWFTSWLQQTNPRGGEKAHQRKNSSSVHSTLDSYFKLHIHYMYHVYTMHSVNWLKFQICYSSL